MTTMEKNGALPAWVKTAGYVAAAAAGAGLMYLLDPARGNARRAVLGDRTSAMARQSGRQLFKRLRDLEHRAEGALSELRGSLTRPDSVNDRKLEARVHTNLGRAVEYPHAVRLMALDGHVVLGGSVPPDEIEKAVRAVAGTKGVKAVENRLTATEGAAPAPKPHGRVLLPALLVAGGGLLTVLQRRR